MTDAQVYYLDTSALVKRYAWEDGSDWIQALCEREDRVKAIAHIGVVETVAALNKKRRQGNLSQDDCAEVIGEFLQDTQKDYVLVAVGEDVINRAVDLTQQHPLRGYDAVHLSCALALKSEFADELDITFVVADDTLRQAADAEGFQTERPEDHTPV